MFKLPDKGLHAGALGLISSVVIAVSSTAPAYSMAATLAAGAGRRKTDVLEAAGRVIADRGADATRFADVAAESGVPVSTLQYYFGSRGDMLVAAFRHASGTEIAALEADLAAMSDPWDKLEQIITTALAGYQGDSRLWIESWHFGIRDPEIRADTLADPDVTGPGAVGDVIAALRELLRP